MLIKSVPYEVLLFAAQRHGTWPGIKPQKSALMMKLSWLMFSHTRVTRGGLGEIDLCQINISKPLGFYDQENNCNHRCLYYKSSCPQWGSLGHFFTAACFSFVRTFNSLFLSFWATYIPPLQVSQPVSSVSSLAASQSFSLLKVITHWAHQPAERLLCALTDEPEAGGCRRADSFFSAQIY